MSARDMTHAALEALVFLVLCVCLVLLLGYAS